MTTSLKNKHLVKHDTHESKTKHVPKNHNCGMPWKLYDELAIGATSRLLKEFYDWFQKKTYNGLKKKYGNDWN